MAWRFYVYEIVDGDRVIYVGKGSGDRMYVSAKVRGGEPREVARFKREKDAYAHEVERISWYTGLLNIHRGGNGSWCKRRYRAQTRPARFPEIDRIGTRAYAARLLIKYCAPYLDPNKLIQIIQIAYPQWRIC